jgi:hypothetical protein
MPQAGEAGASTTNCLRKRVRRVQGVGVGVRGGGRGGGGGGGRGGGGEETRCGK